MIDVLFFAQLQEAVGKEKVIIEADDITIRELKNKYLTAYNLETIDQAMAAINEEYAEEDTIIKTGDVVAFIPPVSGG